MRILNCYMANDSKGHFVTAKEAAKHNRRDVLCCVSCGCPLTLQRGNDGQQPWFEHDQMTVAEKILLRCTWLDPAEKEARRLHLQGMTVLDYTVKVRKWFCVTKIMKEKSAARVVVPGYTAGRGGGRMCRRKMPGLIIRYRGCNGCLWRSLR